MFLKLWKNVVNLQTLTKSSFCQKNSFVYCKNVWEKNLPKKYPLPKKSFFWKRKCEWKWMLPEEYFIRLEHLQKLHFDYLRDKIHSLANKTQLSLARAPFTILHWTIIVQQRIAQFRSYKFAWTSFESTARDHQWVYAVRALPTDNPSQ